MGTELLDKLDELIGLEDCREAVEARVRAYEQQLTGWREQEPAGSRKWTDFLRE